jgi:hypothetical protein
MSDKQQKTGSATQQLLASQKKITLEVNQLKEEIGTLKEQIAELLKMTSEQDIKLEKFLVAAPPKSASRGGSAASKASATSQQPAAKKFPTYTNWLIAGGIEKYADDGKFNEILEEETSRPANSKKTEEVIRKGAVRKYVARYLSHKPKDASEADKRKTANEDYTAAKKKFEDEN